MIYTLLISMIILFFLCYLFSGRDLFAPATIQILTFAGATFLCIYFMISMGDFYTFHWKTIGLIAATMALSAVIGIYVHTVFKRIKVRAYSRFVEIHPISNIANLMVLAVACIAIFWALKEIIRIGGGTFGTFVQIMHQFRVKSTYTTEVENRFPFLLRQMMALLSVLFLLYEFNLIHFFKILSFLEKSMNSIILLLIGFCMLLQGSRTQLINEMIAGFMLFHLLRIRRLRGYKPYSVKNIVRAGCVFVIILILFYMSKSLVGRISQNEKLNIADYTAYYCGSEIIELDQYLQDPIPSDSIWGKETFYSLNQFLSKFDGLNIPAYPIHLEFRPVVAGYRANTYTFLRSYHHDFGMIGVFVLHVICMLFLSIFYELIKKSRKGYGGILIFSFIYYTVVMSFFADRFFSNLVSMNFAKSLVMLLVLYEAFFRKSIRFAFHHGTTFHAIHRARGNF